MTARESELSESQRTKGRIMLMTIAKYAVRNGLDAYAEMIDHDLDCLSRLLAEREHGPAQVMDEEWLFQSAMQSPSVRQRVLQAMRERTPAASPFPIDKTDDYESRVDLAASPAEPALCRGECTGYANPVPNLHVKGCPAAESAPVAKEMLAAYDAIRIGRNDPIGGMTAAYQIARQRCAEEMLGEPTNDEIAAQWEDNPDHHHGYGADIKRFIANRRKRLSQPVETLQERVEKSVEGNLGYRLRPNVIEKTAAEIIALVRAELEK